MTLLDFCEVPVSSKHSRPPQPNLFSHQMRTAKQQTQKGLRGTKTLRNLAHCSVFLTPPALMTGPLLIRSKWVYGMAHRKTPGNNTREEWTATVDRPPRSPARWRAPAPRASKCLASELCRSMQSVVKDALFELCWWFLGVLLVSVVVVLQRSG